MNEITASELKMEDIVIADIPTDDPQLALEFCNELISKLGTQRKKDHKKILISVVIPVYNEEDNLLILYKRLTKILSNDVFNYEFVFVDDGSGDRSVAILSDLVLRDPQISIIELARNFGHQIAISAGLEYSRGDAVVIMDADLQDPPEVLPDFIKKWQEGNDVVYAVRKNRKESVLKRTAYKIFYRMLKRIASIDIPLDSGDFCIMDRRVVEELKMMPERNRFVRGIRSWVGLKQVGLVYERDARFAGKTKYTFTRLLYLALDGLISFSYMPLRLITLSGLGVSILSIFLAVFYTIKKIFFGLSPPGFATLVVSIFFFSGVQLITIGVIGEYVGRIFEEVKQRPLYIVKRIMRSS